MSCFSSSSSAVSREIQNLRNEIKILATEAKRKHSNLSFQNSKLEEDMIDERRQKSVRLVQVLGLAKRYWFDLNFPELNFES